MAVADDELLAAVNGLEDAGAAVNATKPIKPIRSTKKKTTKKVEEGLNAGMVTFTEEDQGPFNVVPGLTVEDVEGGIEEALKDCGVSYAPKNDTPNEAGPGIPLPPDCGVVNETATLIMQIRRFAHETNSIWVEQKGTPSEKHYGTKALWSYIIAINGCHTRIVKMSEQTRGNSDTMKIERDVYCLAELIDNETNTVLTRTIMTAATDESWLKDKTNALSSAYGLAQTRAEERLARTMFGYQAALAGLDPTPAEELDINWGAKKEQEL